MTAGITLAFLIHAATYPVAALILGVIYAASGGAIANGVTATLLDLDPAEVQAAALEGALENILASVS